MNPQNLILRRSFSCAHFYHQKKWDIQKNQQTFGKCFTEYGHGHDYQLEVTFTGTSLNVDFSNSVIDFIVEKLDHQHLNFVITEFKDQVPTTENLALYLLSQISQELTKKSETTIAKLRLYEKPDLWVELDPSI